MTVNYTADVANGSRGFGNFFNLLFRWKGSIYRLVLFDLFLYVFFYYLINVPLYRWHLAKMPEDAFWRNWFHMLVEYCEERSKLIPLEFLLGFYVSQIVTRWWSQYMNIPWPDSVAIIVATGIQGHDERGRLMRRTIMRYANLCLIFTFCTISPQARKRFLTMDHMVEAGFLLPHEKTIIDSIDEKLEGPKYYVPIVWACAICLKAKKENRISADVTVHHLIKELCKFRMMSGNLLSYDWISIPLVYTQAVTLSTYVYFFAGIIAKQLIEREDKIDIYFPVFHFLQFFFLMGWLKVAETLINPFGEDDDDFEVNWLIDRDIMVSYMIADELNYEFPEMIKDPFWSSVVPTELYYTENALKFKTEGYAGSAVAAMSKGTPHKEDESKKDEDSLADSLRTESYAPLYDRRMAHYSESAEDIRKIRDMSAPSPATNKAEDGKAKDDDDVKQAMGCVSCFL